MTYQEVTPTANEQERLDELRRKNRLQFDKEKGSLKFYMLGKGYVKGMKALGFLKKHSLTNPDGSIKLRKDKATPEMHHMVRIAFSVTQLRGVLDEETCICLALLHDTQEDEAVQTQTIQQFFGGKIAHKNWKLTKKFAGEHKNSEEFYKDLAEDAEASIVKGLDRCDNLENMIGVFGMAKIRDYCNEAENVYLPMLHTAAELFPEQQYAYYAIRLRMKRAIKNGRDHADLLERLENHMSGKDDVIRAEREKVAALEEENKLVADKLAKAYGLTNSYTFEEHRNRVDALVNTLHSEAKKQGIEPPNELTRLESENRIRTFVKLRSALEQKILDPNALSLIMSVIQAELGISSLEMQNFVDESKSVEELSETNRTRPTFNQLKRAGLLDNIARRMR